MKFAEESPEPPLEALYDYTFVNTVNGAPMDGVDCRYHACAMAKRRSFCSVPVSLDLFAAALIYTSGSRLP